MQRSLPSYMKNNCSAKDKGYVESIGKRRNENLKNCLNRKKTRLK
jgi:hypothetical protein